MSETLGRSESQQLVDRLLAEINKVKLSIKQVGVFDTGVQKLQDNKDLLQKKLNELLTKGKLLTEDDYNAVNDMLDKRDKLSGKAKSNQFVFVGIGLGVIALLWWMSKK